MMSFSITPEYVRGVPAQRRQAKLQSWLSTIQEMIINRMAEHPDLFMTSISSLDLTTEGGHVLEPSLEDMIEMSLVIKSKGFTVDMGARFILGPGIIKPVIEISWPIDSDPYSCYHEAQVHK